MHSRRTGALPSEPLNVTAVFGDSSAAVHFAPPTFWGYFNSLTYLVQTPQNDAISVVGAASPIVVHGLANGVEYQFTVRAVNNYGHSERSNLSNSVIPGELSLSYVHSDRVWRLQHDSLIL